MEKSNETFKFEITNIINSIRISETCVSMKKEVTNLHETLIKFTKGKIKTWLYSIKSKVFLK